MAPFFFAAAVEAQTFRLGRWEGALDGVTEYSRQDTTTGGQPGPSSETFRTAERLSLRNAGAYIYDPRLVTFTLGGSFGLNQERLSFDGTTATRSGTLYGYEAFAGILSEAPYSLNLFANRDQSITSQIFGGRTEIVRENRGGTLFAKRIYVPSSLTLRQELLKEETRTGSTVSGLDQTSSVITYQGDRGWENSEASLRYEFIDLADRLFPNLSYQSHEGSFYYGLDFGPELNRRWDSRVWFFTRSGATPLTTGTVDETLRVDHTERLQTDYRYFLLRLGTVGGATTTHTGAFGLRHRLYESLTTSFRLDTTIQTLPGGERETYRGRLDLAYSKRLPWDGRLNIGLGGGMQFDDQRFRLAETFVPQETHVAGTPFALPMQLANPFVITASIVVTKTAFGPLPPGCIAPPGPPTPLVLGRDYTVRTVGDVTEIVPIPCAGVIPGINPGDTIAVDYRFAVPRSLSFTTATWRADASVDYRWVRPYLIFERIDQNLVSGQDGRFLSDVRSATAGTELRYDGQRLQASLLGEVQHYTSRPVAYDAARSTQFVGFTILPNLTLTLSADEAWFQYSQPRRQTRTLSGRATLNYALDASLFAEAFGGMRLLKDTLVPTERTLEAGLRVRWTFRRIEVDPTLQFIDRRLGETNTKDYRAILRLIRRF